MDEDDGKSLQQCHRFIIRLKLKDDYRNRLLVGEADLIEQREISNAASKNTNRPDLSAKGFCNRMMQQHDENGNHFQ